MNTLLWTLQVVLAVVFAGAGAVKLIKPREWLSKNLGDWVDNVPAWFPKALGTAEVLAAIGLIVPPLVHIAPVLTPFAASGLVIVMLGAIVTHARRGEFANVAFTVALAVMAGVVAWGRFGPYAF
ncbi:DoxX family protein [Mycobacterium sp. E796]|uniref:DoxX family protein n=1 Tax=Mycobacterium sp. E796 TaxID=1834151 RepID=UPI0008002FEE|nr:DoxX family protein [Mycobacterium sp. E796]OBI42763.1 DoxX family protein [Mycobacterium sp. E796]